jgi:hypothetical protein
MLAKAAGHEGIREKSESKCATRIGFLSLEHDFRNEEECDFIRCYSGDEQFQSG